MALGTVMDSDDDGAEADESLDLGVVSLVFHHEVEVDTVLDGLWLGDGLEEDPSACSDAALVNRVIGMSQRRDGRQRRFPAISIVYSAGTCPASTRPLTNSSIRSCS